MWSSNNLIIENKLKQQYLTQQMFCDSDKLFKNVNPDLLNLGEIAKHLMQTKYIDETFFIKNW